MEKRRRLGKSHIQVSRLRLGCVTFGREIDEATSIQLMSAALDFDINPIDTAEAYGGDQAQRYRHNVLGVDDAREVFRNAPFGRDHRTMAESQWQPISHCPANQGHGLWRPTNSPCRQPTSHPAMIRRSWRRNIQAGSPILDSGR